MFYPTSINRALPKSISALLQVIRIRQYVQNSTAYSCLGKSTRTIYKQPLTQSKYQIWQFPSVAKEALRSFSTKAVVNRSDRYFTLDIEGKGTASLEYRYNPKKNCLTILHTTVPDSMKGLNVGKILALEALQYTVSMNYSLRVKCGFVKYYIAKYAPEYNKILLC